MSFENFSEMFLGDVLGSQSASVSLQPLTAQDYNKGAVPLNPQKVFACVTANPRIKNTKAFLLLSGVLFIKVLKKSSPV